MLCQFLLDSQVIQFTHCFVDYVPQVSCKALFSVPFYWQGSRGSEVEEPALNPLFIRIHIRISSLPRPPAGAPATSFPITCFLPTHQVLTSRWTGPRRCRSWSRLQPVTSLLRCWITGLSLTSPPPLPTRPWWYTQPQHWLPRLRTEWQTLAVYLLEEP